MTDAALFKHIFTKHNAGKIDDFYEFNSKALGEGSYGTVYQALDSTKTNKRAIKVIDKAKVPNKERFEQEITIQKNLDHPHIVKLYEVFEDKKRMYLVMELCTGGELFDRIMAQMEESGVEGQAFDERQAATYMAEILGAMCYLHSKNFVHRDIKPENFLLQDEKKDAPIKVIDYGLAKTFEIGKGNKMHTKAGTPYYVAPEVLGKHGYDEKCDVWSTGVINYILICGYPPFYGDDDDEILKCVQKGVFDFPAEDWDQISKDCKDFIKKMLTVKPDNRPDFATLLEEAWLTATASKSNGVVAKDLGANLRKFNGHTKLRKLALTCVANQLNDAEIKELKATFCALDANKDGTLSIKEILGGMEKSQVDLPPDITEILQNLDTDGSGCIDYTEFLAATVARKDYIKEENLWKAFRVFDLDGDGKITKDELLVMMKSCESDVQKMIQEVDGDSDGCIDFDEFCKMMRDH